MRVLGVWYLLLLAERRPERDCKSAVAVTLSLRYDGARFVCILCMSRQSLKVMRYCTGNQCSCWSVRTKHKKRYCGNARYRSIVMGSCQLTVQCYHSMIITVGWRVQIKESIPTTMASYVKNIYGKHAITDDPVDYVQRSVCLCLSAFGYHTSGFPGTLWALVWASGWIFNNLQKSDLSGLLLQFLWVISNVSGPCTCSI